MGAENTNQPNSGLGYNSYIQSEKQQLLQQIEELQAKLKGGKMSSWYIIQLMLNKLNSMASQLTNGLGKAQQDFQKVQGDLQKVNQYIRNIEADRAADPPKDTTADAKQLAKAINNLNNDKAALKKLIIDGDPKKGLKPYHGDDNDALNMYYELFGGNPDDPSQGGTIPGLSNFKDDFTGGKTLGELCKEVAAGDKGALSQLVTAVNKWGDMIKDHQKDPKKDAGPFDGFINGYSSPDKKTQYTGVTTMTTDLSATLTDENNKLNQDSQIINSVNSIAQSGVKNSTDMYAFFTQHQIAN